MGEVGQKSARPRIVLATRSAGKIRELSALLDAEGFATVTLDALGIAEEAAEEHIEIFDSFEANAATKATWFAKRLPSEIVLAEDSGLVVDVLGGAPGVRSKRWAGSAASGQQLDDDNNAALLRALEGNASRAAHYACVAVLVRAGETWSARGETYGRITRERRGAGGFGYDPFFESAELGVTFGEASAEQKARVSHRARAVREVLRLFRAR